MELEAYRKRAPDRSSSGLKHITAITSMALLRTRNDPAVLRRSAVERKRVSLPLIPATPALDV